MSAPTHSIDRFHFSKSENLLVAEMSDLGRNFAGRIWNDACDVGFGIAGRTRNVLYILSREERAPDGELQFEEYTPHTFRGDMLPELPKVVLFND